VSTPESHLDEFDVGEERAGAMRQLAIVFGVIVALLLLVWVLFLRGGGDKPTSAAVVASGNNSKSTVKQTKKELKAARSRVETFEVFAPKDPFEPLISPAVEAPASGSVETTSTPETSGSGAFGETTTIQTGSNGSSSQNQDTVGGHRVKVIDVFRESGRNRAQIEVDGTVYTVDEGERFAENFQLVSASGQCATMLFGDDEFTLCEGEEILK
jgi:hypothetical protein